MLALQRNSWRIRSEEELLELLHEVTEFLLTGRTGNTTANGHGLMAVQKRFESVFGINTRQAYFDAIHGTGNGLRGILERFTSESREQLIKRTLYSMIDSFLTVAYGERLCRDYMLMHQDGRDYFAYFRGLLPSSILEQEDYLVMGTVLVRSPDSSTETPMPRMREIYVRHPQWLSVSQQSVHASSP